MTENRSQSAPDVVLPAATLHEAYGRKGALPSSIKPIDPSWRLYGPAVTVSTSPGQNLRIHEAMYTARPGDVLVVDVGLGVEYGYWGEIMTAAAQALRLGGLVINGGVRDHDGLVRLGFPIFAERICMRGTAKNPDAAGAVNATVTIGDVEIAPGDLIVGDADGVVAIARADIEETIELARAREGREESLLSDVRNGVRTLDFI